MYLTSSTIGLTLLSKPPIPPCSNVKSPLKKRAYKYDLLYYFICIYSFTKLPDCQFFTLDILKSERTSKTEWILDQFTHIFFNFQN